ncbi:hypothetical protein, variant [Capsaspora owczarzaki ATCC 30864]|nr:hypothetical protein, variant [Capsaspora owczarzaki ATCC 30864]
MSHQQQQQQQQQQQLELKQLDADPAAAATATAAAEEVSAGIEAIQRVRAVKMQLFLGSLAATHRSNAAAAAAAAAGDAGAGVMLGGGDPGSGTVSPLSRPDSPNPLFADNNSNNLTDAATNSPATLHSHAMTATAGSGAAAAAGVAGAAGATLSTPDAKSTAAAAAAVVVGQGHTKAIASAVFAPDQSWLVTGSRDTTLRLWHSQTAQPLDQVETSSQQQLAERKPASPSPPAVSVVRGLHTEGVDSVAVSPDGKRIASAAWDTSVYVLEASTGNRVSKLGGLAAKVNMTSLHFSPAIQALESVVPPISTDRLDENGIDATHDSGAFLVAASSDARQHVAALFFASSGQEIRQFSGHTASIIMCRFSPGGRRVLTASKDTTLRIWSAATGQCNHILIGHSAAVVACAWSPSISSPLVASASLDGVVGLWNPASGVLIRSFYGHAPATSGRITVEFSPDSSQIVSASSSGLVFLWDVSCGAMLRRLDMTTHALIPVAASDYSGSGDFSASPMPQSPTSPGGFSTGSSALSAASAAVSGGVNPTFVASLAALGSLLNAVFSLDGSRLLCSYATEDYGLRVIDSQIEPTPNFYRHVKAVVCCAFSPDGKRVVSSAALGPVCVWDAATCETLLELTGHSHTVKSCCFQPRTGKMILTSSWDKTFKLWDSNTGTCLATGTGHDGPINYATFGPRDPLIATASGDGSIKLWRYATSSAAGGTVTVQLVATLASHKGAVNYVVFSPDGTLLVSCGFDRSVRLWSIPQILAAVAAAGVGASSPPIITNPLNVLQDHTNSVLSASFSPDGSRLATTSLDKSVKIWDVRALARMRGGAGGKAVSLDSDGGATDSPAADDVTIAGGIGIYATASGFTSTPSFSPIVTLHQAHLNAVTSSAFSSNGARLLTVGRDRTLKVWSLLSSSLVCEMAFRLSSEAECVACAPVSAANSSMQHMLQGVVVVAIALQEGAVTVMDVSKSDPPTTSMELLIELQDFASLRRITSEFPHTINAPLLDGRRTVVHRAAERGNNDLLGALLSANAPFLLVMDSEGETAIDVALVRNHKSTVQLLVRRLYTPPFGLHPSNGFAVTRLLPRLIRKYPDVATELLENLDMLCAPPLDSRPLSFFPCVSHAYLEVARHERPLAFLQSLGAAGIGRVDASTTSDGSSPSIVDAASFSTVGTLIENLQSGLTAPIEPDERLVRASNSLMDTSAVWSDLVAEHDATNSRANVTTARQVQSDQQGTQQLSHQQGQLDDDDDDEALAKLHDDSLWYETRLPVSLCVVPLPYILGFDARAQVRALPAVAEAVEAPPSTAALGGAGVPKPMSEHSATIGRPRNNFFARVNTLFTGKSLNVPPTGNIDSHNPEGFTRIYKTALRETFMHAALRSRHKDIFRTGIMHAVMDYKWQAFGRNRFLWWLLWYTCFVVLYTIVTALAISRNAT